MSRARDGRGRLGATIKRIDDWRGTRVGAGGAIGGSHARLKSAPTSPVRCHTKHSAQALQVVEPLVRARLTGPRPSWSPTNARGPGPRFGFTRASEFERAKHKKERKSKSKDGLRNTRGRFKTEGKAEGQARHDSHSRVQPASARRFGPGNECMRVDRGKLDLVLARPVPLLR